MVTAVLEDGSVCPDRLSAAREAVRDGGGGLRSDARRGRVADAGARGQESADARAECSLLAGPNSREPAALATMHARRRGERWRTLNTRFQKMKLLIF